MIRDFVTRLIYRIDKVKLPTSCKVVINSYQVELGYYFSDFDTTSIVITYPNTKKSLIISKGDDVINNIELLDDEREALKESINKYQDRARNTVINQIHPIFK